MSNRGINEGLGMPPGCPADFLALEETDGMRFGVFVPLNLFNPRRTEC